MVDSHCGASSQRFAQGCFALDASCPSRSQFDLHSCSRWDSPLACHPEARGLERSHDTDQGTQNPPIRRVNFCAEDRPAGFAIRSPSVAIAAVGLLVANANEISIARQNRPCDFRLPPLYEATCVIGSCEREGWEHNGGTCAGDAVSGNTLTCTQLSKQGQLLSSAFGPTPIVHLTHIWNSNCFR